MRIRLGLVAVALGPCLLLVACRQYTVAGGLADDQVSPIVVSASGAVWVGTQRGVCRFDGQSWATFTSKNSGLADDRVLSIAIAPDGALWFGTQGGGVSRYAP